MLVLWTVNFYSRNDKYVVMQVVEFIISVGMMIILLTPIGYCQSSRVVAIFDENSSIMELGSTEQVGLKVKNAADANATYNLYIGSTDTGFRYWVWFENYRYGSGRVQKKITLGAHEERTLIVNVFGGKTGNYELIVGPDGSDASNKYDSIEVRVINRPGKGLFSNSPGLGASGVFLALVAATIVLLSRGYKINRCKSMEGR
ncbi:MAG: hypothetical protein DRN71_04695 [Candidatus Nanohalarchaeota archaeon]|nr:MAG: hypothetical protein DRN71_04695 [Candidatus Nanohaloarchaeota archaeon]